MENIFTLIIVLIVGRIIARIILQVIDVKATEKYNTELIRRVDNIVHLKHVLSAFVETTRLDLPQIYNMSDSGQHRLVMIQMHDNLSRLIDSVKEDVYRFKNIKPENQTELKNKYNNICNRFDSVVKETMEFITYTTKKHYPNPTQETLASWKLTFGLLE